MVKERDIEGEKQKVRSEQKGGQSRYSERKILIVREKQIEKKRNE